MIEPKPNVNDSNVESKRQALSPTWMLHNVDCRDWLKACEGGRFHAVITDPPYRVKATSAVTKRSGDRSGNIYGNHVPPRYEEWFGECQRVLKPGGSLFVFEHPNNWKALYDALETHGFEVIQTLIYYVKNRHGFIPSEFFNHYDVCIYATNGYSARTWNFIPALGFDSNRASGMNSSDVYETTWKDTGMMGLQVPGHKDVAFLRRLVFTVTNLGDWVLDPFAGTGTTILASLMEGRNAVGCEIRKEVCDEVRNRLKSSTLLGW